MCYAEGEGHLEIFEGELGASVLDAQKVSPSVCPPLFCQWPIGRDEGGRKSSKCQLNTELLSRFPLNMSAAKRHQHKKNSNFKYLALFPIFHIGESEECMK